MSIFLLLLQNLALFLIDAMLVLAIIMLFWVTGLIILWRLVNQNKISFNTIATILNKNK